MADAGKTQRTTRVRVRVAVTSDCDVTSPQRDKAPRSEGVPGPGPAS